LDSFDDRYLGVKSSDPTQDNDGNALVSGALYFSDSANEMRVYDGANWIAATSAGNVSLILYEYTATNGQTTFSGSDDNSATLSYTVDNLQVVMNGIVLDPSDFTATNGTSVVLAAGAATNDLINIYAFKSFTTADMVSKTNGGTFSGPVTFGGSVVVDNITIDGTEIDLSSGDLTLDVAGDINLDADGGDVNFKDGGTSIGYLSNSSGTLLLGVNSSDADFKVQGNDGGSTINAFTLDMSEAGAATFNAGATFNGTVTADGLTVDTNTLHVDATNNRVGMSTTSPTKKLSASIGLNDTDGLALEYNGENRGGILLNPVVGEVRMGAQNSTGTYFTTLYSNGSERFRITSGGSVGIGTASPTYQMTVFGSSQSTVEIESGSDTGESRLYFTDPSATGIGEIGYYHNGNTMRFSVNNTERMRLTADGLTFNGDTAAANALDDYEEGGWTPSVGGNTTYHVQSATYTKIGRAVYIWLYLQINSLGTGSTNVISGLPFTPATSNQYIGVAYYAGIYQNTYEFHLNARGDGTLRSELKTSFGTGQSSGSAWATNGASVIASGVYYT
jgi:hypothetical protein